MVQRSKCHGTVLGRAFCVERDGVICYNQRNGTGGAYKCKLYYPIVQFANCRKATRKATRSGQKTVMLFAAP